MTSTTTKPETVQPEADAAIYLFDDWFDPIEAGLRDRVRDFIETMFRAELDAALARPRYARPGIARTGKSCIQLGPEHRLNEIADPIPQAGLDRIKPVVKQINRRIGLWLNGFGLRGSACHGVVSCPAQKRWTHSG